MNNSSQFMFQQEAYQGEEHSNKKTYDGKACDILPKFL